ncbi:hypothetical protein R75465_08553 [Paraburkholderia aspalathi]|nr:hypothetical protein R75465_08553 [Paraburkholderia aspalathi]
MEILLSNIRRQSKTRRRFLQLSGSLAILPFMADCGGGDARPVSPGVSTPGTPPPLLPGQPPPGHPPEVYPQV